MLASTSARLDATGVSYKTNLIEISQTTWRHFEEPVHAFVSSLAIHHLDGAGKAQLYKDLANALAPGGILVV